MVSLKKIKLNGNKHGLDGQKSKASLRKFYGGKLCPEEYIDFVNSVTSQQSKSHSYFKESLDIMKEQGANPARLLTTLGLIGEGAEVSEIVKKCIFQGKPFDEDAQKKLKSELSDCMWYIAQGCIALNTSIEELIDINTAKLSARYPDGFDKDKSNNRKRR